MIATRCVPVTVGVFSGEWLLNVLQSTATFRVSNYVDSSRHVTCRNVTCPLQCAQHLNQSVAFTFKRRTSILPYTENGDGFWNQSSLMVHLLMFTNLLMRVTLLTELDDGRYVNVPATGRDDDRYVTFVQLHETTNRRNDGTTSFQIISPKWKCFVKYDELFHNSKR